MTSKWQKNLAIAIIILVVLLIGAKLAYNYQANKISWVETDLQSMTNTCLDDLAGYSVRFPKQSQDYCDCSSKALMEEFSKTEYLLLNEETSEIKKEKLLPVILECYNAYQDAMFESSN